MALRKAAAYTKRKVVPFTRVSKRKGKSYVKTIPPQKIVKFTMGSRALMDKGKLPYRLTVLSEENAQIRHNALEACRQYINKQLEVELLGQYYFKIIIFPHHIQRENKMLTGAGSDRMQTGMQLSFGKSSGKAAIVKKNAEILTIAVPNDRALKFTRDVIKKVRPKLPCKVKLFAEKVVKDKHTAV